MYTADLPPPGPYSEYIVFADDITQIVAYPGTSTELMAGHTETAIQSIYNYENKWKIQTNSAKFKIIPMAKQKYDPVIVDGEILPYATDGRILGLNITATGFKSIKKQKKRGVEMMLNKLRRFKNLDTSNKLKLYNAFVRSSSLYPPVPTHAAKKLILSNYR